MKFTIAKQIVLIAGWFKKDIKNNTRYKTAIVRFLRNLDPENSNIVEQYCKKIPPSII